MQGKDQLSVRVMRDRWCSWLDRRAVWRLAVVVICCALMPGAERAGAAWLDAGDDPVGDMNNTALTSAARARAVDAAWAGVKDKSADNSERRFVRDEIRKLTWKGGAPVNVRERALACLLSDTTAAGREDNRNTVRLWLPLEGDWKILTEVCKAIAERAAEDDFAWRVTAGSLVRSYARALPETEDAKRPERAALLALFPDQTIDHVAYNVFLKPGDFGAVASTVGGPDRAQQVREAAWELLSRLDPDGRARSALLAAAKDDAGADPLVRDLARLASELKVVPITGSELAWAMVLLDTKDSAAAAWWERAREAVSRLSESQATGLQMRHVEPVVWASAHRAEWLAADQDGLYGVLQEKLKGRRIWRQTGGAGSDGPMSREALDQNRDRLVWGDLLAILVIDEAIHTPKLI